MTIISLRVALFLHLFYNSKLANTKKDADDIISNSVSQTDGDRQKKLLNQFTNIWNWLKFFKYIDKLISLTTYCSTYLLIMGSGSVKRPSLANAAAAGIGTVDMTEVNIVAPTIGAAW